MILFNLKDNIGNAALHYIYFTKKKKKLNFLIFLTDLFVNILF